jgi:hypothetical protein
MEVTSDVATVLPVKGFWYIATNVSGETAAFIFRVRG